MDKAMILGFVRHLLSGGGTALAGKGYIEASEVEMVVGAIITLAGFAWSYFDKKSRA